MNGRGLAVGLAAATVALPVALALAAFFGWKLLALLWAAGWIARDFFG